MGLYPTGLQMVEYNPWEECILFYSMMDLCHPAGTSVISFLNDNISYFCSHYNISVYEKRYFES